KYIHIEIIANHVLLPEDFSEAQSFLASRYIIQLLLEGPLLYLIYKKNGLKGTYRAIETLNLYFALPGHAHLHL
ncbi:hypothetical protein ACJX0J_027738, partial [Zea mays]